MKRLALLFVLSLLLAKGYSQYYSFSEVCESGQTLYYTILDDSTFHSVKVVAPNVSLPYWDGSGPIGFLRIPDTVSHNGIEYTVVAIDDNAFMKCYLMTSIVLGSYVESIGSSAFLDCTSLTTVDFGASLVSLGPYAFHGCISIESLEFPESLKWIGEAAFYNCHEVAFISFPSTLESIASNAFANCSRLTSLVIPRSVSYIDYWAFLGNTSLTSIVVEEENPIYDSRGGCNAIIQTASNKLIKGCKTTIIPNDVVTIGETSFYLCVGMEEMTIPSSVKVIEELGFAYCQDLKTIHFSNSTTTIEDKAFWGCGLLSVNLPRSVTTIEFNPFANCPNLVEITVDPANPTYDSRNNCNAIVSTSSNTLKAGCMTTIIPSSVVRIGDRAFYNCDGLESILIPKSVKNINKEAFSYCSSLVSITLPSSVKTLGEAAFAYCENLNSIHVRRSSCPTTGQTTFSGINQNVQVHIPKGSYSSFQASWNFQNLIEEYMLPEGAEWWYEIVDVDGNRSHQRLVYNYDTLMNNQTIKVLVKENTPLEGQPVVSHEYVFEDSCRLYRWVQSKQAFELLYDYTTQQGEEWRISLGDDEITIHVDTVMSMSIGNSEYDVMRIHDDRHIMTGDLICGVGNRKCFFPEYDPSPHSFISIGMRCFWRDGDLLFRFGDTDCDAILSADETVVQDEIRLYPNPTNDYITIDAEGLNHLMLFSLSGEVLYSVEVTGDQILLDLSRFKTGVYLVRLITEKGVRYKKVTVSK